MGWMTRVMLIRHAESAMNLRHRQLVGGRSNHTPLTPQGAHAAAALGRELAAGPIPDVLAHTCAARSAQTARLLHEGAGWAVPLIVEDGLLELSQGSAEGQARDQWWTPAALAAMRADPRGHRLAPDAESHAEVQARMRSALRRLATAYPGGFIVAIGHGIATRTLAWSLLGGGHETFQHLALPNLARVELDVDHYGQIQLSTTPWSPTTPQPASPLPSPA